MLGEPSQAPLVVRRSHTAKADQEALGTHFDIATQLLGNRVIGAAERTSIRSLEIDRCVEAHAQRGGVAAESLGLASNAGDAPGHFVRREVGRRATADGQPAVAKLRGATQGRPGVTADPDRWMGPLDRMRMRADWQSDLPVRE